MLPEHLSVCGELLGLGCKPLLMLEKTCFQNKTNFITEDQFVQHMNTTIK
jgi:hypothetical protein